MNMFLLLTILLVTIVTMVCALISTVIIVKKYNGKEIVKKSLIISGICLLVILIIGLAVWVSNIETDASDNDKTTTTQEETSNELDEAGFNKVSLDEYLNLVKSSDKSIILIARPTCYYCQKFTPVLKEAMEDMNLTINYVNTDELTQDDWSTFNDSLDYLTENEWGTPLTLIVKDGKVVDDNSGYVELDAIKKFFNDNGF